MSPLYVKVCDGQVDHSIDVNDLGVVIVDITVDNTIVGVEILSKEYQIEKKKQETVKEEVIDDMIKVCDDLAEYIAKIRYQNWPNHGLGIGLKAEEQDELIQEADRVIRRVKRAKKKLLQHP